MTINHEQLVRIANMLETGTELMGSKWQNCEAEVIVSQTIVACKNNYENHGDAFSWATRNAVWGASGNGLVDNARGRQKVGSDLLLVAYEGSRCRPDGIAVNEHGKPLVFRVTQELLDYCEALILRKQKPAIAPYPSALN